MCPLINEHALHGQCTPREATLGQPEVHTLIAVQAVSRTAPRNKRSAAQMPEEA
jgi:hypothetical protein